MKEKINTELLDAAYAVHTVLHKAEQAIRHLEYDKKVNEKCLFQMQEVAKETKKMINDLVNLVDAQGQKGTWDMSPYHTGLFNGLEMALSIFEKREPKFRDFPNGVGSGRQFPKSSKHEGLKTSTSSDDILGAYEYTRDRGKIFQENQERLRKESEK